MGWSILNPKMKAGAILTAAIAGAFAVYYFANDQSVREEIAIQTLGLRKNAQELFRSAPMPTGDVTGVMIASRAATHIPDDRFADAMSKLRVDDGFPKEKTPRLVKNKGIEVHIIGKGGEFYVEFRGEIPRNCEDIQFSICL